MIRDFRMLLGACALACGLVASELHAGDVTWTITSGTANFSGRARVGLAGPFPFLEQAPGSLTSTMSGTYRTTNTFTSSLDFGPEPVHPDDPNDDNYPGGVTDPQYLADFDTWANVTLPASVAAQNKITYSNSGTWAPGVLPLVTVFNPPFPPAGSGPAVFAVIGYDDFSDPMNPGQNPLAFSGDRTTFWTNKTSPPGDAEDPLMFPTGAPVDLTVGPNYGTFDSGVATHNSFAYIDSYLLGLDPFGLAGRIPTVGSDRNSATALSVLGRNGSEYTMTLHWLLDIDLSGVINVADFADFVVTINTTISAKANILPGDANFDGTVNIFDINQISSNWSGAAVVGNLTPGDVNGDGIVNIFDINLVSSNWGSSGGGGSGGGATAVPEPATLFLAAMSALALCLVARRCPSRLR